MQCEALTSYLNYSSQKYNKISLRNFNKKNVLLSSFDTITLHNEQVLCRVSAPMGAASLIKISASLRSPRLNDVFKGNGDLFSHLGFLEAAK